MPHYRVRMTAIAAVEAFQSVEADSKGEAREKADPEQVQLWQYVGSAVTVASWKDDIQVDVINTLPEMPEDPDDRQLEKEFSRRYLETARQEIQMARADLENITAGEASPCVRVGVNVIRDVLGRLESWLSSLKGE